MLQNIDQYQRWLHEYTRHSRFVSHIKDMYYMVCSLYERWKVDLAKDRKRVISSKGAAHITNGMALIRCNGASIIIRLLFYQRTKGIMVVFTESRWQKQLPRSFSENQELYIQFHPQNLCKLSERVKFLSRSSIVYITFFIKFQIPTKLCSINFKSFRPFHWIGLTI